VIGAPAGVTPGPPATPGGSWATPRGDGTGAPHRSADSSLIRSAMPTKRSAKDRAAEEADYATWKITVGADLLERHDVKPGIIPERLWRRLYIMGLTPQKAADQAAVSAYNTMSPADRLKRLKR
jgi:hypothetical protein